MRMSMITTSGRSFLACSTASNPSLASPTTLRGGAGGFLLKDAPEEQLVAAIRIAADGGSIFAPSITRRLVEEFARAATPRRLRPSSLTSPRASWK